MARLLVLFFASGCAALIYETVWFYLVQLVVGASSISVAVLLCAFMGGMALGSWLLPKLTPKGAHPFKVVAALEAGIALLESRSARTSVNPAGLPDVRRAGRRAISLRSVVCFLILTPPTILMGATLPAIARSRGAESVGYLYMANLAGGATGTLLAGFYLLRVYDTVVATTVAVVINVVIAVALTWMAKANEDLRHAWHLRHRPRHLSPPRRPSCCGGDVWLHGSRRRSGVDAAVVTALRGKRVYVLAHPRCVPGGTRLGGFAGTAFRAGSGGERTWADSSIARRRDRLRCIRDRERLAALAADGAVPPHVRATPSLMFTYDALRCAFALLPATLLWGASFPLTLAAGRAADFGGHVARINAINTAARSPARSPSP
jgi:spermidine synthase